MKKYDYLIVGSGLYAATFAYEMTKRGKKCLVIERRGHVGGNIYCENILGINVHKYGAHIFHTSDKEIWDYVNQFCEFNNYVNSPIAHYKKEVYNLPFNMKLIKEYTEKQWNRSCKELPAFIIKRLPVRFTYNNNYFNDRYQGIPIGGYNVIIDKMLENCDVELNVDYLKERNKYKDVADKVLYTGMIDEYFDYSFGKLEYRSLKFENEVLEGIDNYQGNAVVNYTSHEVPYTRIIEHKHFEFGNQPDTVITKEYPIDWQPGLEAYYPVNDSKNSELYQKYKELLDKEDNVIFGGRLAEYKYYDMDKVISAALDMVKMELEKC